MLLALKVDMELSSLYNNPWNKLILEPNLTSHL